MSECKGCQDYGSCLFANQGDVAIHDCPCRDCLVKVTCEEPCEKLEKHYYIIWGTGG